MNRILLFSILIAVATGYEKGWAQEGVSVAVGASKEAQDRSVDRAAIAAQEQAIQKLTGLLKKYRGTRQEPVFLSKLAELQLQNSAMYFRVAHGSAHTGGKALDLAPYKKTLKTGVSTLNELIAKYPNFEEIHLAYFRRGKAYEEIGDKTLATRDYLHLTKNFPESDEAISAYMSLAEFAIEANDHPKAIGYLVQVEKHPENPHYPFALYKLSWSHFNLKNIPQALSYTEKGIAFYRGLKKETINSSDEALRENVLLDATVFYMEGFEQKLAQYQVPEALGYFKKLEDGPLFGKMAIRFAKLLRSHGHDSDLVEWKNQILAKEHDRPESLDVLITTYEHLVNKRRFPQLIEASHDIVTLYQKHPKYESFPKAQKLILDTAEQMQAMVVKNKNADGVGELSSVLAKVYDSFTQIVADSDPRIPRVHYNLAETLFEIKDFTQATTHYRWVVEHGSWQKPPKGAAAPAGSVADASLKAIASKYEVFKSVGVIPGKLSAKTLGDSKNGEIASDEEMGVWIAWIDKHVSKTDDPIDNFYFEANRALYGKGYIKQSVDRMNRFAHHYPDSKFAIPSASLVMDTYIATANWAEAHDVAKDFLGVKAWKGTEFGNRLFEVAADTSYKIIEQKSQAKEYAKALDLADDFLEDYSKSKRLADCLILAGAAAMETGEKTKAETYFTRLISEAGSSDGVGSALLARARIAEERYRFGDASRDYRAFLAMPAAQAAKAKIDDKLTGDQLKKRILFLAWLSGDAAELKTALGTKAICTEALATECDRFQGLSYLTGNTLGSANEDFFDKAFDHTRKGHESNRAIWATIALERAKQFPFRDRNVILRQLGLHWDDTDPLIQMELLSKISVSVPKAFQLNRASLNEVAPLRADEKYITRRVEVIREMENAGTKIATMPWSRIKAAVLSELGGVYLDFSRALSALPAPKALQGGELAQYEETIRKITMPFEEKGQDMRGKAFEIASNFAIEEETFQSIADPFFKDNPSQAKALIPGIAPKKPTGVDFAALNSIEGSENWEKRTTEKELNREWEDHANADWLKNRLMASWGVAIRHKNWARAAFYLQESKERKAFTDSQLALMRAVTFAQAGAQAEGLSLIAEEQKHFADVSRRMAALDLLNGYYAFTYSKAKMTEVAQEKESLTPKKEVETAQKGGTGSETKGARKPASAKTNAK